MNHDELAQKIRESGSMRLEPVPSLIRNALDDTYKKLGDLDVQSLRRKHWIQRLLKRTSAAAAAVVLVGGLVIGSGFVSPAMADSLKQVPWINSIYERFGDAGLTAAAHKGMVTTETYSQTKAERTVTISDVMYDGARVSFVVKLKAEGTLPEYELGTFGMDARVNGEQGPFSYSTGEAKRIDKSTALHIVNFGHSGYDGRTNQAYQFPDKFELTLQIAIIPRKNIDNGIYEFKIPIEKNAPGSLVVTSSVQKEYKEVTLRIEKLEITPATIHLVTLEGFKAGFHADLSARFNGLDHLRYSIFDEYGNEFESVNGSSSVRVGDEDLYKGTQDYEGVSKLPKSITIKPYAGYIKDPDGKPVKNYIEELEIKVELPST